MEAEEDRERTWQANGWERSGKSGGVFPMAVMQDAAEGFVDRDVIRSPILGRDGKSWSWDWTIVQALMRPESVIPRNKGIGDEGQVFFSEDDEVVEGFEFE